MKISNEVFTTTNYGLFKDITGNRDVIPNHISNLTQSMEKNAIPVPIIVNQRHEVIDGQNRLEARKALKLPIHYVKIFGAGIEEVQVLNQTVRPWTGNDIAKSHAEKGNENYKMFLEFKSKFGLGSRECIALLSGSGGSQDKAGGPFQTGAFKVASLKNAEEAANKICEIRKYYDGYKRRSFVMAMIHLFGNKNYNHSVFLNKLNYNGNKLQHCPNRDQYIRLIESIYNWHTKEKIRFI